MAKKLLPYYNVEASVGKNGANHIETAEHRQVPAGGRGPESTWTSTGWRGLKKLAMRSRTAHNRIWPPADEPE